MLTKSKAFGKALKKIRLKKKLTQEDLSLEAQLARVYISELEYGKKYLLLKLYLNYPKV